MIKFGVLLYIVALIIPVGTPFALGISASINRNHNVHQVAILI